MSDPEQHQQQPRPLRVDTPHIIWVGMTLWAIALVLTLVIPALHSGERSWWPWTAASGLVLGGLGMAYVRRGRGNASVA